MKKPRSVVGPFATILFLLLALSSSVVTAGEAPDTLVVGPGGDCATIQAAIDAAPEGATVLVLPGTYTENLRIETSLALVGSGEAIVQPAEAQDPTLAVVDAENVSVCNLRILGGSLAVSIDNSDCTISGCAVIADVFEAPLESVAIEIASWSDPPAPPTTCTIVDCTIEATEFGIVAYPLVPCTVAVIGCRVTGVEASPGSTWDKDFARGGYRGAGLSIMGPCNITVADCTFEMLAHGASLGGTGQQNVVNSVFRSCGVGVLGYDVHGSLLAGNEIASNTLYGFYISHDVAAEIRQTFTLISNTIEGNGAWGIYQGNPEWGDVAFRGWGNIVRDNAEGDVSPDTLEFPNGFFVSNPNEAKD